MCHNTILVLFETRRNTMRKTIITVFAFMVLFGFVVSGAMAQTTWEIWTFTPTEKIDNIQVGGSWLQGKAGGGDWRDLIPGSEVTTDPLEPFGDSVFDPQQISVVGPNGVEYVIDGDTVGYRLACQADPQTDPIAFVDQPVVPADGSFIAIAVSDEGTVFILFETATEAQYILVGTPTIPWVEDAKVRFTPRSLNQSSKGKWVTCKISGLPDGYIMADVDLESLCIVSINGETLASPIPRSSSGPSNSHNKKKLMLKFDREALTNAIPDDISGPVDIVVTGIVGEGVTALPFIATDTIKTKAPKVTE
jgi:hypothetical protein